MRIQTIELTNYKAFLGTHKINVEGKNVFIYGENGSGKSSLYYALKDFFQSSSEDINLNDLENIFVPNEQRGKTAIKITFNPNNKGENQNTSYVFDIHQNDTNLSNDTSIRDGNKLKSFLTYKHLLAIHYLKKDQTINLFDLLVKGVLKHFKYPLTDGKEMGELWEEVENCINEETGREYNISRKKLDVANVLETFNKAFGELFKVESQEYILKHAKPILDQFNHNIDLNLSFNEARPNADYTNIEGAEVHINLKYAGRQINRPHLFLNEARLSAIAISIYLGMIKRHIQGIPCKLLFMDDIFIGLDIANRLPLLKILESDFSDYQIFITTYDKPWFEYVRGFLEGKKEWKVMEFYSESCQDGTEVPIIFDNQDLLTKAENHLNQCDFKASAVYTRSAFEKMIRRYCEKKQKPIAFKPRLKDYTSDDFWKIIKQDLQEKTKTDIETYRALVLNPFSHYNTERHEFKTELQGAIQAIKILQAELNILQGKKKIS